jgi:hypothetical protein
VRHTDRSRTERDWKCPQARFWGYEYGGRGIAPVRENFDYFFGTVVHDGIEASILQISGQPFNPCNLSVADRIANFIKAQGGDEQDAAQWGAIGQGLVLGFMRTVWPKLNAEYELVSVEREVDLQLTPSLLFQARPDLLMRHRQSGALWYFELKTTGWIEAQWVQSWSKAAQLQLGALAAEAALGESLAGCVVVGLYKGRKGRAPDRRQSSPFAWGWRSEELPGIMAAQYSYEEQRRKGWERFLTVHAPGGVEAWVANMPEEILDRQFVTTDPIFLRRDVTDALVAQVLARESEIASAMAQMGVDGVVNPEILARVFPQHFFNCTPAFGANCEFNEACWMPWVKRDPIGSGLFTWREPHHEAERKYFALKEVA